MNEPLHLLLVEDSAADAKLVVQQLRRAGHAVEFERVDDPAAMRAALATKTWDAIICDWSMPRFSALGALGIVKEHGLDVPFIIVSGCVGEDPAVEAMRAGAHDYLLKDRLARLPPVIERELREANMRKAHRRSEIAERRAVEAGLRESERQIRQLVENLPDLAWSARPDGHIDFYNRPWYEYTGSTFEEMEGWGWKAAHRPEMVDAVLENWTRSLTTGEPFEMEFPLRRADGTFRWFLTRVRPLRDAEGRIARWFGTSTDIDEARRARAEREQLVADLRKAVELRDEFLSIASHELRTPLTALQLQLQGTTHLVEGLNSPGNAKFLRKLEVARRQANRLAGLVDGLLDVARTSLGRLTLELDEVDLVTIARDVIEQHTVQAQRAGCSIQFETESQVVGRWDRARLDQVVTNLVTNSIKYGAGHPIEVRVTSAQGWARLVVRDHGIGIRPEDVIRVFARFEIRAGRFEQALRRTRTGAVHRSPDRRGSRWNDRRCERGRAWGHVHGEPSNAAGVTRPARRSSGCRGTRMNESTCAGILVVDDDDDIRDTIIQCFGDEGYQVFGARHGKEALEQLRNGTHLPCVILLDIMMPVMDGRGFRAEQLLDPRLCDIPIVVITANANLSEMENELKTSGALRKPVSLKQLFKVAELHCGKPDSQRIA